MAGWCFNLTLDTCFGLGFLNLSDCFSLKRNVLFIFLAFPHKLTIRVFNWSHTGVLFRNCKPSLKMYYENFYNTYLLVHKKTLYFWIISCLEYKPFEYLPRSNTLINVVKFLYSQYSVHYRVLQHRKTFILY